MSIDFHPDLSVQKLTIGEEKAPLLVVDNFISNAEELVELAAQQKYIPPAMAFPGIRALAPKGYQQFLLSELAPTIIKHFQLECNALRFSMCHFSLVTTPPEKLSMVQRIPHVDAFDSSGLAAIHYLFHQDLGGTAFYRHRKTGYEIIDEARKLEYFKSLEAENDGPNMPGPQYINGDTPLFQQIARQDGVFNRLLVYRRTSLHSGCIDKDFVPDPSPLTGRLSINSFIDVA